MNFLTYCVIFIACSLNKISRTQQVENKYITHNAFSCVKCCPTIYNLPSSMQLQIDPIKKWQQWFPCLALNIKRETLALSKFSIKITNCKSTIFEGLMKDWLCQISIVETNLVYMLLKQFLPVYSVILKLLKYVSFSTHFVLS